MSTTPSILGVFFYPKKCFVAFSCFNLIFLCCHFLIPTYTSNRGCVKLLDRRTSLAAFGSGCHRHRQWALFSGATSEHCSEPCFLKCEIGILGRFFFENFAIPRNME